MARSGERARMFGKLSIQKKLILGLTGSLVLIIGVSSAIGIWLIGERLRERAEQQELPVNVTAIRNDLLKVIAAPLAQSKAMAVNPALLKWESEGLPAERAADYIFGYTVANDVTARDLQSRDGQWTRAKGFDTFCPVGPVIETELDTDAAIITTRVNGEVRQHAPLTDMIHSVADIIAYASAGERTFGDVPASAGPIIAT